MVVVVRLPSVRLRVRLDFEIEVGLTEHPEGMILRTVARFRI